MPVGYMPALSSLHTIARAFSHISARAMLRTRQHGAAAAHGHEMMTKVGNFLDFAGRERQPEMTTDIMPAMTPGQLVFHIDVRHKCRAWKHCQQRRNTLIRYLPTRSASATGHWSPAIRRRDY